MSLKERKKYLSLLKIIKKLKPDERSEVVSHLKDDAIEFICECVHNVLYTDLGIKNRTKIRKQIKNNCSIHRLKVISSKSKSQLVKVKALQQEGKGIGFVLSAALPFLIDLFAKKIVKKRVSSKKVKVV